MKYLIALMIFALGLGLIIWGVSSTEDLSLWGITFAPHLPLNVGLIGTILGVITLIVLLSSSPPTKLKL